jgi:hypothetical protein
MMASSGINAMAGISRHCRRISVSNFRLLLAIGWLLGLGSWQVMGQCNFPPIAIHPENPRYFLFRGKPRVLITATEHYGSVINRQFDFDKYLNDAAKNGMTLTRTFLLYRELQTSRNPSSPCKPESPDYLAPYPRSGPGKALDGEPIYDLDQWNPEYFERLQRFLQAASDRAIVVELTLFSNSYSNPVWALNPLNAANNKQKVGKGQWWQYTTLCDRALVERQKAFARKVVQETCRFDNVYYEVCNEPTAGATGTVTAEEVDAWLDTMAQVVRDELRAQKSHLVFGAEAFNLKRRVQEFERTFSGSTWDAVNVHPSDYDVWRGRTYRLGGFMAKHLRLAEIRDFCLAVSGQRKPVILDEDNTASL